MFCFLFPSQFHSKLLGKPTGLTDLSMPRYSGTRDAVITEDKLILQHRTENKESGYFLIGRLLREVAEMTYVCNSESES